MKFSREEEERLLEMIDGNKSARREDNCDPTLNDPNPSPSAILDEDSIDSEDSEASESTLEPDSEVEEKLQGNQTLETAYAKFKRESKLISSAMQKWVVVAQSTHYVTSVLTALVPRLLVDAS